jgi:hypothetical protein
MEKNPPINNDMEFAVTSLVEHLSRSVPGRQGSASCWCALCRADVTALALNMLPPRYSTVHAYDGYGKMAAKNHPGIVPAAVLEAVKRVAGKPKHHSSGSPATPDNVRMRNFLVEKTAEILEEVMQSLEGICSCGDCLSDILTLALNRLAPAYGVEFSGRVNIPPQRLQAIYRDLALKVATAARIVAERPHRNALGAC